MIARKLKLVFFLGLTLAVFTLFGAYYVERLRAGELVRLFADALASYTGVQIIVPHNPSVSLKSGGLRFDNIKFQISPGGRNFTISVDEIEADIDLMGFIRGNFAIRALRLYHPVLLAGEDRAMRESWYVGVAGKPAYAKINVQRILAQKGEMVWNSAGGCARLEHINISANLTNAHEAEVSGDFYFTARYDSEVSGNLAFRGLAHYYAPNLTFRHAAISFTPISWPLPMLASPLRIGFDGALNMENMLLRMASCRLSWPDATLSLKGAAMLDRRSISAEFDLEGTPEAGPRKEPVSIQGFIERQSDDVRLEELEIQVGENTGSAEVSLNFPEDNGPPAITGTINFGKLDIMALPGFLKAIFGGLKSGPWPTLNLAIFCKNIIAPKLGGRDLKFSLSGANGNYLVKNLRLDTGKGRISANLQFLLPDKFWKIDASGQNVALAGFTLPICDGDMGGAANFSLHAMGDDLLKPGLAFIGNLDLDVKNFRCAAKNDFLGTLSPDAKKLLGPILALNTFDAKILFEDNLIHFSPIKAAGENFRASGEAYLDLNTLTLAARVNAQTGAEEVALDFIWPENYEHGTH